MSKEQVTETLRNMKNGKAGKPKNIRVEMLKNEPHSVMNIYYMKI